MRAIEILKAQLTADGFGGLVADNGECGCELEDLAPCENHFSRCDAGYKHIDPRNPQAWAIWKQKEPPTDEQWDGVEY